MIVFGDVARAVCVLLGPVFVRAVLRRAAVGVAVLGWLKSLFEFAWYKVVAQALVLVFGGMLLEFFAPFSEAIGFNELLFAGVHMIALRWRSVSACCSCPC